MKIVILDGFTENPGDLSWDGFRNLGELTVYDRTPDDFDTVVKRIGNNQAVIVNKVKITKEILDACPRDAGFAACSFCMASKRSPLIFV